MPAFNYFNDFSEQLSKGVHHFVTGGGDTFKIAVSNVTPDATMDELADITAIDLTNTVVGANHPITITASETSGTTTIGGDAVTITATAGGVAAFRYYTIYNDTSTGDKLVGWFDHGSSVTLAEGESFKISFNNDDTAGTILTITQGA